MKEYYIALIMFALVAAGSIALGIMDAHSYIKRIEKGNPREKIEDAELLDIDGGEDTAYRRYE